MDNTKKIVVIQANSNLGGGARLFWLFSRTQLELVLKEIEPAPVASAEAFCQATIDWQGESLPVVNLEKYFGISEISTSSPIRHLVLKGATREEDGVNVSLITIPIFADLKMGALNFEGRSIAPDFLQTNSTDILGAYELAGRKIAVLPDIHTIVSRSMGTLKLQGRR